MIDARLGHLPEKLAGVGGERLDIPAMPLGEDRVDREAGLAGARNAGANADTVTRNRDGEVLEIMLAGTDDGDAGLGRLRNAEFGMRNLLPVLCTPHSEFRIPNSA